MGLSYILGGTSKTLKTKIYHSFPEKLEEIKKDPQRITKFKTFVNKYKWVGIDFP